MKKYTHLPQPPLFQRLFKRPVRRHFLQLGPFTRPGIRGLATCLFLTIGLLTGYNPHVPLSPLQAQAEPIQPVPGQPATASPLSPDNPVNQGFDADQYLPYNDGYIELDLWRIEQTKFLRSRPVLSPDKKQMAYSEVIFMPTPRQTFSKLYLVTLPLQPAAAHPRDPRIFDPLPPDPPPKPKRQKQKRNASASQPPLTPKPNDYDPNQSLQQRQTLVGVGSGITSPFDFKTLTIIDWSASGNRLLVKQKSGALHTGLKTSDILIYDQRQGTVTIYPEIHRALVHYWNGQEAIPDLDRMAWDIFPLGWLPQSDSVILFKGYVFDKQKKKFLGLWQYDLEAERAQLVSLTDEPAEVAANGTTIKEPPEGSPSPGKKPSKRAKP